MPSTKDILQNSDGFNKPFPKRLRELIEKRKVSQAELAKQIGVTRQAISSYSLGLTLPDIEKFEKIADFFSVSFDYLMGRTNSPVREYQSLVEQTGLSSEAAVTLVNMKKTGDISFRERAALNIILSSKCGIFFLDNLFCYLCLKWLIPEQGQLVGDLFKKNFDDIEYWSEFYIAGLYDNKTAFKKFKSEEINDLFFVKLQNNLKELKKEIEDENQPTYYDEIIEAATRKSKEEGETNGNSTETRE